MWAKNHNNPYRKNTWQVANTKTRQRLQVRLDKIAFDSFAPAHILTSPETLATPLVLSSPHSGRDYPPSFLAQSGLSLHQLRNSEDCYIDRLIEPLTDYGIPMIAANFPRIYLDLNRGPDEWPPEALASYDNAPSTSIRPISPRARAGLGVVPLRIGPATDIYPHEITGRLVQGRLDALYFPYHDALRGLLQSAKEQFGHTLLLDCHSMPGHSTEGVPRADIVLGNCHGDSCRTGTIEFIQAVFTSLGYDVMLNHPYAGGYITAHYGRPDDNIQAVQIEINKDLYLNPDTLEPHIGMAKLANNMKTAILQIKDHLIIPASLAAE
ncbi:MAG: N-formylglutamate amidohydrolase [Robiginitomaculum sp.]|nr:N-formylglutamate amidohydrolase [Robiginitomaculum sp.]